MKLGNYISGLNSNEMAIKKLLATVLYTSVLILITACGNGGKSNDPDNRPESNDFRGQLIYVQTCAACHQADGKGIAGIFPPLSKSDFIAKGKETAIEQVIRGKSGVFEVNGLKYNNVMPPQSLDDEDIAAVLTYVFTGFGNNGPRVSADEVKKVRSKLK